MSQKILCVISVSLGFLILHLSEQVSFFEKDLILTSKEKHILDKFQHQVSDRLPHAYMKKEIYLIRWLRATNFNIPDAEERLMKNLKWRNNNNIDHILEEDWDDYNERFIIELQGCDKGGNPVGEWDVRQAVISGQSQKMMRFFDKLYEELATYIRISQEKGENVTQSTFLYDLSGYNLIVQGCPLCIPVYVHFFQTYENYFPGLARKIYAINVPQLFIPIWNLLAPLLSEQTRSTISLYGQNANEWKPILRKEIDPEHLTRELGGFKQETFTMEELRADGGHFQCQKYAAKL